MTTEKKNPAPHTGPTTWTKGKSGNPGGRSPRIGPNGETAAQLARVHTVEAIDVLREVMMDKKATPVARVSAANGMLDRGWGKPKDEDAGDKPDLAAVLADLISKLPS